MLAHGADVSELHRWVEPILLDGVPLGSEVDVAQSALMRSLSSYVHLLMPFTKVSFSNQNYFL